MEILVFLLVGVVWVLGFALSVLWLMARFVNRIAALTLGGVALLYLIYSMVTGIVDCNGNAFACGAGSAGVASRIGLYIVAPLLVVGLSAILYYIFQMPKPNCETARSG